jgi:hypothetical protein
MVGVVFIAVSLRWALLLVQVHAFCVLYLVPCPEMLNPASSGPRLGSLGACCQLAHPKRSTLRTSQSSIRYGLRWDAGSRRWNVGLQ